MSVGGRARQQQGAVWGQGAKNGSAALGCCAALPGGGAPSGGQARRGGRVRSRDDPGDDTDGLGDLPTEGGRRKKIKGIWQRGTTMSNSGHKAAGAMARATGSASRSTDLNRIAGAAAQACARLQAPNCSCLRHEESAPSARRQTRRSRRRRRSSYFYTEDAEKGEAA